MQEFDCYDAENGAGLRPRRAVPPGNSRNVAAAVLGTLFMDCDKVDANWGMGFSHLKCRSSVFVALVPDPVKNCVPTSTRSSFSSATRHFPLCLFTSRVSSALPCRRESPSHPPGAKDHVSGILDSSAKRNSGEVVAENWNSVPLGRWSLPDRRVCEMSAQRLNSVVCYSQQASRVNAAMRGPSKEV
jgi:hypothetical protein